MIDYNLVENEVTQMLGGDKGGHGMDHIYMVLKNANKILESEPKANKDIVKLACLLHDVDDYKFVGIENSKKLLNAKSILDKLEITEEDKKHVLEIITDMGYSNYLKGVRPKTLEGMIVSDADMCDLGASGIVRTLQYGFKVENDLFNANVIPNKELDLTKYQKKEGTIIDHFFDKVLKIRDLMMTEPGKKIANRRHKIMIDFLENFFEERHEDCSEWVKLLEQYK